MTQSPKPTGTQHNEIPAYAWQLIRHTDHMPIQESEAAPRPGRGRDDSLARVESITTDFPTPPAFPL
jgi:hypothetical protein